MTTETQDPTFNLGGQPTTTPTVAPAEDKDQPKQPTQPQSFQGDQAFMIVGDRAYKDREAVITKLTHADQHIRTLETERATDRATIKTQADEIERLKLIIEARGHGNEDASGKSTQTAALSKEDVVSTVRNVLSEDQRKTNLNAVYKEAQTAYGEKMLEKIGSIASELGYTGSQLDELAKSNPTAFRKLFLPAQEQSKPNPPHHESTLNTNSLNGGGEKPKGSVKGLNSKDVHANFQARMKALEDKE